MEGKVFISVSDAHKAVVPALAKDFVDLGFELAPPAARRMLLRSQVCKWSA